MFTCMLCYGVAIKPVKCSTCETVYCTNCLPPDAFPGGKYDPKKSHKRYACYKQCGSKTTQALGRIERNLLNGLVFKCQHEPEGCEAEVKYENYKSHLEKDCVKKLVFPAEPVVVQPLKTAGGNI